MQLLNYRIHFLYSLQTHSGGASTSLANHNYSQIFTVFLAVLGPLQGRLCSRRATEISPGGFAWSFPALPVRAIWRPPRGCPRSKPPAPSTRGTRLDACSAENP